MGVESSKVGDLGSPSRVVMGAGEDCLFSGSRDSLRWVWVGLGYGRVAMVMDQGEIDPPFYNLLM